MSQVLQLLKPITIGATQLTAHNVPEPATGDSPDPAAWSSVTTYTQGQRVYSASTHLIYEATSAASNTNKDPTLAANIAFWITVGATNRWRMFDQKSTSQTTRVGTLQWTVTPGTFFNGLAVVNITNADTIDVVQTHPTEGTIFTLHASLRSPPSSPDHYAYCFEPVELRSYYFIEDVPPYPTSSVQVTLTATNGTNVVGCGAFLMGPTYPIGNGLQYGARVGIQDYSKKQTNSFGDLEIVEGAFSSKGSFQMWVDKADVDSVKKTLASVRALPCLWRGSPLYDSTVVYGIAKDWEITIQYFDVSLLNLELEGITEQ
jgi:hypothetical protein